MSHRSGFTIGLALLVAFGIAAPWIGFYQSFLMKFWCSALFACAFNLLAGYGGLISFGHAAFFGGAAYIAGYTIKSLGFPPVLGILAGGLCGAGFGVLAGYLSVQRKGIYFSMVTLAMAQLIYFVFLQAPFSGGEDGLQNIPRGHLLPGVSLDNNVTMYYFVFAIFLAGFLAIARLVDSPFGQAIKAIRQNEPRAISLGYQVPNYKVAAFVISATISGIAGATKSVVFQLASLSDVHWMMSGEIILITLVGGLGTLYGPVIGAFLIVSLENQLATTAGSWSQVILGLVFIACVSGFRQGIAGTWNEWARMRLTFKAKTERFVPPDGQAGPPAH
ncbi:branched-chain amino acid ABC transporter permease [Paraburkholderia sp. CNPSo 3157]|uniref:Branched-chain amino acid ABC transporter permease n=1 Tax=Paraburkholderia franconis TaxID=2654983 RepID=A0A7X1NCX3_9BURK|nr:branched-chain amino acid ABC transporter permease [Paraburkholderia franconis]MPW19251.1 branched-chain amino acid ABC transporter permease [Paraburkholderia franconis]